MTATDHHLRIRAKLSLSWYNTLDSQLRLQQFHYSGHLKGNETFQGPLVLLCSSSNAPETYKGGD